MLNNKPYHSPIKGEPKIERCAICDEPTGRAGVGEDSICRVMKWEIDLNTVGNLKKGQELEGICEECLDIIEPYSEDL